MNTLFILLLIIKLIMLVIFWSNIKRFFINAYAYLFLDDTKYYWTGIRNPVYVGSNLYPNHIITELRGYWKDGTYREIEPNLPFKKEMIEKFEGCKIFVTIVNMETRELFYVDLLISNGKFW